MSASVTSPATPTAASATSSSSGARKWKWWETPKARQVGKISLVLGIVGLLVWWFIFHPYVSTDDARVAETLVRLAPSATSGRVESIHAVEGDRVKAGQVLVELDHRIQQANLQKARARAELTKRELGRMENLVRQATSPQRELDNARANAESAEAELKLAEVAYDNTFLKSPVNGLVVQKTAEIGNILESGQTALTIADVDHAWIAANVEETEIGHVKPGQEVQINVDEGGSLTGKVSEVRAASAAQFALIPSESASGSFTKVVQRIPIKVALDGIPEGRVLRAGQSVEIKIRVR